MIATAYMLNTFVVVSSIKIADFSYSQFIQAHLSGLQP